MNLAKCNSRLERQRTGSGINKNESCCKKKKKERKKKTVTIANPTSAFLRAGPSFVPSPVTATTCRGSHIVLSMIPERQNRKPHNCQNSLNTTDKHFHECGEGSWLDMNVLSSLDKSLTFLDSRETFQGLILT